MNKNRILYFATAPLSVLASTLFALSLQPVIDAGIEGDLKRFVECSIWSVLLCLADVLLVYVVDLLRAKIRMNFSRQLRTHYFDLIFRKCAKKFMENDSSSYLTNLTTDADVIAEKYCDSFLQIYQSLWSLFLSVIAILSTQWILALYVIPFSFLSVNLPKLFQKHATQGEKEYLASSDRHLAVAQENIQNHAIIKVHHLIKRQSQSYGEAAADLEEKAILRSRQVYRCNVLASGISEISYVLILIFSVVLLLFGKLSVGAITSVSQLLGGIMYPFEVLPGYLLSFRAGREIYRKNEQKLENETDKERSRLPFPSDAGTLRLSEVSFRYQEKDVLDRISISLFLKRKYAIVGKSGSGKSTLAKLLMGFLEPQEGKITLENSPLQEIDEEALYRNISYEGQNTFLFQDTLKENILLGKQLSAMEYEDILQTACLQEVLRQLPNTKDAATLSGGEAKRIALARCLASHPKFLILDEILSALDNQTARNVEKNLLALPDTGMLMITHHLYEDNLKQYDCIFVMKDGRILEQGNFTELMKQNGEFRNLLQEKK